MATITGRITVNNKEIIEVDAVPSAGSGTEAPIGSLALYDNGTLGLLYVKVGAADTAWEQVNNIEWLLSGNNLSGATPQSPNEWFGSLNDYDVVFRRQNSEVMRLSGNSLLVGLASAVGGRLQVGSTTLGDEFIKQRLIDGSSTVTQVSRISHLATTGAVSQTQDFLIPTDHNAFVKAIAVARQTGGTAGAVGDGASYERKAHFRNNSGTATMFSQQSAYTYEIATAMNMTMVASGANARVEVTGAANRDFSWGVFVELTIVSA